MAHLVFGHDRALAAWAAKRIPHVGEAGFGPCTAIGIASGPDSDDKLLGVCVFHDAQEQAGTIQLSMVATTPKWATRPVISALLYYPFVQLGANKVWTATPIHNVRALRFNKGIGFRQDGVLREHFGKGEHAVICSMLRKEYMRSRWHVDVPHQAAAA